MRVPATKPPAIAISVAESGFIPETIKAAAIEAPNVIDPSAVISAKLYILKLINMPRASSDKINPIVSAPMSNDIVSVIKFINFPYPTHTLCEFALSGTCCLSPVIEQMQDAL
ncbi:hypothetical protein SDC9_188878 [bioreactor metagenome]|uniref:Uncharacterized protein n=1 Tax=bioreactor metagenome TaxID=1076179 RepID=A0A645HQJ5_9ZZZZ